MKTLPENKYSDPIDNSCFDDPNIKKLSDSSDLPEDAVIKIRPCNKNQSIFKIHNHCGYLKIGPKSYFITPKIGGELFLETIFKAIVNPPNFKTYQNELTQENTKSYFDEMIAYLFIGSFNRSLSGRVRRGYINKNISTYKSSGKIDIGKSKEFFAYFSKPPTWSRNEWSKDTKFNKALRSLFLKLSHLNLSSDTRSRLVKIGLELADTDYTGFIDYRELLHQLDRVHENYMDLFELAGLVDTLNFNTGISSGPYKSYSLLLPTWLLFEQACKSEIARSLNEEFCLKTSFAKQIVPQDPKYKIRPDIVIKNKTGDFIKMMGDCKYSENDKSKLRHLFQLNTYMDACQHFKSFILYPTSKTEKIKPYPLNWGYNIDIINIPINNYKDFSSALKKHLLKNLSSTSLNVVSA